MVEFGCHRSAYSQTCALQDGAQVSSTAGCAVLSRPHVSRLHAPALPTNAVKHFKLEQRAKRRIHSKPSARQIKACRPWLESEIRVIHPEVIVCLGATAAQSLMGSQFRLTQHRGEVLHTDWAPALIATIHPST